MIVKNEETRIGRAILSARNSVDEIVVVDTGSTDRTRAIARDMGAIVLDFPFQADFSAARNVSLAACAGDWILVLDADEFFPLSAKLMLETAVDRNLNGESNPYKGYYILRHNYEENEGWVTYSDHVLRLFRNSPGVKYKHRVHETVEESLDLLEGKYGKLTTIPLSHYLFERSAGYLETKHRVYVDQLLKDIADDPGDATRYDYLGCEYTRMGRLLEAEGAFRKLVELDPNNSAGRESLAEVQRLMGRD